MVKGFFNPPFPALKAGHPSICLSHASWLMLPFSSYSAIPQYITSVPYVLLSGLFNFIFIFHFFFTSLLLLMYITYFYIAMLKITFSTTLLQPIFLRLLYCNIGPPFDIVFLPWPTSLPYHCHLLCVWLCCC